MRFAAVVWAAEEHSWQQPAGEYREHERQLDEVGAFAVVRAGCSSVVFAFGAGEALVFPVLGHWGHQLVTRSSPRVVAEPGSTFLNRKKQAELSE